MIYGSCAGFHAVDLDSASVYDVYLPKHATGPITPHTIVMLPNSNGMQLLLCYDNEGVYVNTYGKVRNKMKWPLSMYIYRPVSKAMVPCTINGDGTPWVWDRS